MVLNRNRSGFILGVVFLILILVGVFIFSYNSIVRHQNIKAHHEKLSSITSGLAKTGVLLLSKELNNFSHAVLNEHLADLKTKTADELGGTIDESKFNELAEKVRNDFQNFLNAAQELKYQENSMDRFPVCNNMRVRIDNIVQLSPLEPMQRGRDPIEKYGRVQIECEVEYRGLVRVARLFQNFRVVNMVPGPFARFSLFVSKTPDPESYNSMGINIAGQVDSTFQHSDLGMKLKAPLFVFNGTDTESIKSIADNNIERTDTDDKKHLLTRGWIFLGPAGNNGNEGIFLKIPAGICKEKVFGRETGGHFMFGWPTPDNKLVQQRVEDYTNFANSDSFPDFNYYLAETYYGFFTNSGNGKSAGSIGYWSGFGDTDDVRKIESSSSWIYPFGTKDKLSRTLVVGNVLVGLLKLNFLKDNSNPMKLLFQPRKQIDFDQLKNDDCGVASLGQFVASSDVKARYGNLKISDFFRNDFDSFKLITPFNSFDLGTNSNFKGYSINCIFDFMKYKRDRFPDPSNPSLADATKFDKIRVPSADKMSSPNTIKGIHPYDEFAIFFNDNRSYETTPNSRNCYFYGNLAEIKIDATNSNLYERVTEILDLSKQTSVESESKAIEQFLFKKVGSGNNAVNVPRRSGIFHIIRNPNLDERESSAIRISSRKIRLDKSLIVIVSNGSIEIASDIESELKDGAPLHLASIIAEYGDIYLSGNGTKRKIHAYLTALGKANEAPHDQVGRLLKVANIGLNSFEIFGGLAVKRIGMDCQYISNNMKSTMTNFPYGGTIRYNPRFNVSLPLYADAYELIVERSASRVTITGGIN